MAKSEAQILAKLDRPPAAHNFARCNHQRTDSTTNSLINLAIGFPKTSYQWAHRVIQITIADSLSDEASCDLLTRICPENQLEDNLDLFKAFLAYNHDRQYQGITVFDQWSGNFIAGPDVTVPVRPTAVLRENGVLKPIFVIGWAKNTLTYYQRRLLTSILEDAIFSLTDFQNSPGEVLFFPKDKYGIRRPDRWTRHTYERLDQSQLTEQVRRFIAARDEARAAIPGRLREIAERKASRSATRSKGNGDYRPPTP